MKRLIVLCCLLAACSFSYADSFIYANNATGGTPYAYQINKTTGAITDTYTNLSSNNGRGVVVVGNTMYYTSATSPSIYSYNLTTHTDNGALFTVSGARALSTIAYDGKDFYIGDYSGTNNVYKYSTSGTLLQTIPLSKCLGFCDGLEYFQKAGVGYLISNEADEEVRPYDVYDLSGNLITAGFIDPTAATTGIAFDGTDFFTSNISNGSISEWDSNGVFVKTFSLTGAPSGFSPLVEDLSADYAQVLPPSEVPEPSSFFLLGSGLIGLVGAVRRKLTA